MKHLLAILFVLSFSISSTRAQAKISLGIQSGINIPGLKIASINPVVDDYKTVLTPYFGVVMEAGINDKWSILTEVNYATMAITKDGSQVIPKSAYNNLKIDGLSFPSFLYANFYSKIQLNYIEVPMMLKYYFKENEKVNFFINGGPVAGILLHGHVKTVGFDKIYTDAAHTNAFTFFKAILTQDQNLGDRVKPINFGLQGAIGMTLKGDKGEFFTRLSGSLGIMNIQEDSGDGENNTKAINIAVGYLFHLSK